MFASLVLFTLDTIFFTWNTILIRAVARVQSAIFTAFFSTTESPIINHLRASKHDLFCPWAGICWAFGLYSLLMQFLYGCLWRTPFLLWVRYLIFFISNLDGGELDLAYAGRESVCVWWNQSWPWTCLRCQCGTVAGYERHIRVWGLYVSILPTPLETFRDLGYLK